jgi:hypothetical protein
MHRVTIYPLGNADTTRIDLSGGKKILIDYADTGDSDDPSDKRIDLPTKLREDLNETGRDYYDDVVFTHIDWDHICGASDFFHFRRFDKYQGGNRVRMNTLWVPAAAILEKGVDGDARIIRQEARYRLEEGEGIRVFSSPGLLDEWLRDRNIDPESRRHLFTDAGELVPTFNLYDDGVEFFVHSPHATRSEQGELINRNSDAIALQATFLDEGRETKIHFFSDLEHEDINRIVRNTEYHGRTERLQWDLFHLPHHSSYKSLGPEKGERMTEPVPRVKRLYEEYGNDRGRMISTSDPIPTEDTTQPPHRQAAAYYESVASVLQGEYLVTMEHPSKEDPEPIVIEIDGSGASVKKGFATGVGVITERTTPRAG